MNFKLLATIAFLLSTIQNFSMDGTKQYLSALHNITIHPKQTMDLGEGTLTTNIASLQEVASTHRCKNKLSIFCCICEDTPAACAINVMNISEFYESHPHITKHFLERPTQGYIGMILITPSFLNKPAKEQYDLFDACFSVIDNDASALESSSSSD